MIEMKVLITGATDFIGGSLVDKNINKGNNIIALVLKDDPGEKLLREKGVEIVTDFAPYQLYVDVNVTGMENICKAALKVQV